jgi:predicted permease
MQAVLRDLRFGARSLRQSPALALVAVLALTLGIGLTTTMFSIVYGALMKGLPFEGGERIVLLERSNTATGDRGTGFPIHDFADIAAQQRVFTGLAAYSTGTVNVSGRERAERFDGGFVTANLFALLRVQPVLGRDFREGEDRPGAEPVAIIGHRMWQERYAGASDVIGQPIRANGVTYTVVGVMPEGFRFPETEEIWLPRTVDPLGTERGSGEWVNVVGRLRDGTSADQASVAVAAIAARLAAEHEATNEHVTAQVIPFVNGSIGDGRKLLYTMLGAVGLVLLIACTNVANLLLARAAHRTKEVSIRAALGASRWAVVRQFLLEAFVLAGVATLLAVVVAQAGIALFNAALVDTEPPFFIDIALHPPVLLFSAGLALATTLLAGLLPALQSSRPNLNDVLKEETRGGSAGLRIGKLSRGLVMFEIALSCGLLVAAGLMVKSVTKLRTVDYGFRTDGIFTARLGFPATYTDTAAQALFFERLAERLAEQPAAAAVSLSSGLPGTGGGSAPVGVEGVVYASDAERPRAASLVVTPGFFDVFAVRPTRGRALEARDRAGTDPVAVVNERFVRDHLGGADPIGRRVRLGGARSQAPWATIVGVVPDLHSGDAEQPRPPAIYLPLAQNHTRFVSVAVQARGPDAMALTTPVRDAVAALEPDIPLYWVYSLREAIARPMWFYRVFGTIFMIFGFVALFLAAVGLYAVMAFAVGRRTREFGIRMALGAQGVDVVRLILRQGAMQLGVGMAAGLALAAGVAQLLTVILFEVQPRDPAIFASVVAVLAAAGLLACLLPAWRATRVSPQRALRMD